MRKAKRVRFILILMLIGGMMMGLFGCFQNKYRVDYCGEKSSYQGAKSAYRPGVEVKLYYKDFMTNRECAFYLDGEYLPLEFDTKGAVLRFVMPEHDVTLECRTVASMPPPTPAGHNGAATSESVKTTSPACPECGADITGEMKFCAECGRKMDRCPECHGVIAADAKFCPECGRNLRE